jgi:deoxyribose-phosphate aldolase
MKGISNFIDSTLLRPDALDHEIIKLCTEAKKYGFQAVCVQPCWVSLAAELLQESSIKTATVIGFPFGANKLAVKCMEASEAVRDGANELDLVIPLWAVHLKRWDIIENEVKAVCDIAGEILLKAIIEVGCFHRSEIEQAALAAIEGGAKFIKTSTGYGPRGVDIEDVRFLKSFLPSSIGIKASGGIRSKRFAIELIEAGATRIGSSHAISFFQD